MQPDNQNPGKMRSSVILNYTYLLLNSLSSLIVASALIRGMGEGSYGMYSLAFSLMLFFTLSEFGIGNVFIDHLIKFRTGDDRKKLSGYVRMMFFVYLGMGLIIAVLCTALAFLYPNILGDQWSVQQADTVRSLILIMTVNCLFTFFQNYFFALLIAYDCYSFSRVCHIIRLVLRTGILLALASAGKPVVTIALTDAALILALVLVYALRAARFKIPVARGDADKPLLRKNIRSMLLLYFMPMLDNFYWTIPGTVLAVYFDDKTVGRFTIALTFCQIFSQIAVSISHIRLARVTEMEVAGDEDALRGYVDSASRIQNVFLGLILTGFIVIGRQFLLLWVGESYIPSYFMAVLMMAGSFFPLSQSMLEIRLYAKNKYIVRTLVLAVQAVVNFGLLLVLIPWIGLMGAAAAISVTQFTLAFLLMSAGYSRIGLPVVPYTLRVTGRLLPSIALGAAAGLLVGSFLPGQWIMIAFLGVAAAAAVYAVSVFLTYLSPEQRSRIFAGFGKR